MDVESEEENFGWELSKENIKPLRQGRDVTKIAQAIENPELIHKRQEDYEVKLRTYLGDDPLSIWMDYLIWMEQSELNSRVVFKLKTKCVQQFYKRDDKKYHDDWRFVKICISYAMTMKDRRVYEQFHELGIGTRYGLFYKAWSGQCEDEEKTKEAESVFKKGLAMSHLHVDELDRAYRYFQERTAYAAIQQMQMTENDEYEDGAGPQRVTFGVLPVAGKSKPPVCRIPVTNAPGRIVGTSARSGDKQNGQLIVYTNKENNKDSESRIADDDDTAVEETRQLHYRKTDVFVPAGGSSTQVKENVKKPAKWSSQKVKQQFSQSSSTFEVYEDASDTDDQRQSREVTRSSGVLRARQPKYEEFNVFGQEKLEVNEIPMYPKDVLELGVVEFSPEELMALEWQLGRRRSTRRRMSQVERVRFSPSESTLIERSREDESGAYESTRFADSTCASSVVDEGGVDLPDQLPSRSDGSEFGHRRCPEQHFQYYEDSRETDETCERVIDLSVKKNADDVQIGESQNENTDKSIIGDSRNKNTDHSLIDVSQKNHENDEQFVSEERHQVCYDELGESEITDKTDRQEADSEEKRQIKKVVDGAEMRHGVDEDGGNFEDRQDNNLEQGIDCGEKHEIIEPQAVSSSEKSELFQPRAVDSLEKSELCEQQAVDSLEKSELCEPQAVDSLEKSELWKPQAVSPFEDRCLEEFQKGEDEASLLADQLADDTYDLGDESKVSDLEQTMTRCSKYATEYLKGLFFGSGSGQSESLSDGVARRNFKSRAFSRGGGGHEARNFTIYEDPTVKKTKSFEIYEDPTITKKFKEIKPLDISIEDRMSKKFKKDESLEISKYSAFEKYELLEDPPTKKSEPFVIFEDPTTKKLASDEDVKTSTKPMPFVIYEDPTSKALDTEIISRAPKPAPRKSILKDKTVKLPVDASVGNKEGFDDETLTKEMVQSFVDKCEVADNMQASFSVQSFKFPNSSKMDLGSLEDFFEGLGPEKTSTENFTSTYKAYMMAQKKKNSEEVKIAPEIIKEKENEADENVRKSTNSRWRRCSVSRLVPTPMYRKMPNFIEEEEDDDFFDFPEPKETVLSRRDEISLSSSFMNNSVLIDTENPYNEQVIKAFISHLKPPLFHYAGFHCRKNLSMPPLKPNTVVVLGEKKYRIVKVLGEGAFAKAYHLACVSGVSEAPEVVAKIQRPACPWEFYITRELHKRLGEVVSEEQFIDVSPSIMRISEAFFYEDGSLFLNELHRFGTLLDLVNLQKNKKIELPQWFVLMLCHEMICIVDALHRCSILHGDLKPDNVLIRQLPLLKAGQNIGTFLDSKTCFLKLIDFGQSIDMSMYPPGTEFTARPTKKDFQCIEMKTGKPWSYQSDLYFLAGVMHVLMMGTYMNPSLVKGNKWSAHIKLKRSWEHEERIRDIFDMLINIDSLEKLPFLKLMSDWMKSAIDVDVETYNSFVVKLRSLLGEN